MLVRVKVGVKFKLGLTPSLKLTLAIPEPNWHSACYVRCDCNR